MNALTWLGTTGFVDLVIAITVVEAFGLWAWARWRGGFDFDALRPSLISGLLLMLALRVAVGAGAWPWIALLVALSGLAHLWDLRRRWHRQDRPLAAVPGPRRAATSSSH